MVYAVVYDANVLYGIEAKSPMTSFSTSLI